MGLTLLTERYAPQVAGVLSCWDRVLLFGTLPKICFAEGMTSYLYEHKIRIFDYPRFAEPFRNTLRENAERLAVENGIEIEFLRRRNIRKEDRVKEVLAKRGDHAGLVCILSAMEPCSTYKPWHNKNTGKTYLLPDDGKCLHYSLENPPLRTPSGRLRLGIKLNFISKMLKPFYKVAFQAL